jgi:hypothetical protein
MKVIIESSDEFHKLTVKDVNGDSDAMSVVFTEGSRDCDFYFKPYKGRAKKVHTVDRVAMTQFCQQYLAMERSVMETTVFLNQEFPDSTLITGTVQL